MCCGIAGPVYPRTWPTLPCRRLRAVTQGLLGPLHPASRAAPPVLFVWCRTAWCCALHCTVCALLHGCCGQRAVGSVTHCHAAWGLWAVEILLHTAALPEGSGEWYSCHSLPPCLGAVGRPSPAIHCRRAWGSGQWNSCNTLRHGPGAGGSGSPAMHCLTAWGQWTVQLPQYTAPLPGGIGQWNSCNTLPHCLGAVGSGTPAIHCLTAWGQRAVHLLQCTASLPWGSVQCNSCNALDASLPGGSGQCNFCNALPHCLGAVGSGTAAMHCLTALGQ